MNAGKSTLQDEALSTNREGDPRVPPVVQRVTVCSAQRDRDRVAHLVAFLQKRDGLCVRWDEGPLVTDRVAEALQPSSALMVVWSSNFAQLPWAHTERADAVRRLDETEPGAPSGLLWFVFIDSTPVPDPWGEELYSVWRGGEPDPWRDVSLWLDRPPRPALRRPPESLFRGSGGP